ncbi:MAG: lipid A biosynthesis lauroyl acyltransferase [Variibacter sp.]
MQTQFGRFARRAAAWLKPSIDWAAGVTALALLKLFRRADPKRSVAFAARFMRRLGPWLAEHKVGHANLTAAFPEKSQTEIDAILDGVWDNLGRVGAEYPNLDRLGLDQILQSSERVEIAPNSLERFVHLRDDGKPALLFAAHLANWELPAVVAAAFGLPTSILYRRPNIADIADALQSIRAVNMGTLISARGVDAAFKVAAAVEKGDHVGILVDQHFSRGVDVTFFGRPCKANPLLARMARRFECPIHGARVVRLPDNRFRLELTDEIAPARDASGAIDVAGTMQIVTSVVEQWVREHPEQWLWLHRRWR